MRERFDRGFERIFASLAPLNTPDNFNAQMAKLIHALQSGDYSHVRISTTITRGFRKGTMR